MRANRPLSFDGLETRQLLSAARHLGPPTLAGREVHAMVSAMPIDLSGTLTVNPKAVLAMLDDSGGQTVAMPIRGTLAGVGPVRGNWVQVQDSLGRLAGPDTLQLHNAHGSFDVQFHNPGFSASGGTRHSTEADAAAVTPDIVVAPQHVLGGAKGYNHATESGTITLTGNRTGHGVQTLTLATNGGINAG